MADRYTSPHFEAPNIDAGDNLPVFNIFTGFLKLSAASRLIFYPFSWPYFVTPWLLGVPPRASTWISQISGVEFVVVDARDFILKWTLHWMYKWRLKPIQKLWWLLYYSFANVDDFEQNYMLAWQRTLGMKHRVCICVGSDSLRVPVAADSDSGTLQMLGMWYRWMLLKRGLPEMVLPKKVVRIDKVKVLCHFTYSIGLRS